MKYKWLLIAVLGLSSCSWIEESIQNNNPYYSHYESYQIGNNSSQNVKLSFYSQGEPKYVYAEIHNQSNPVFVQPENAIKPQSDLLAVSEISLNQGQTLLFYWPRIKDGNGEHIATSLNTKSYYYSFIPAIHLIGDSVIVSFENRPDSIVSLVTNTDIWETWYDEKNFIYCHFWRIE